MNVDTITVSHLVGHKNVPFELDNFVICAQTDAQPGPRDIIY